MSSYFDEASLVMIPSGYKTSKLYSVKPTDGSGDMVVTRSNDTATRVGPDGLIEKVRTNLLLQSNSFNTTWTLSNSTMTSGQAGYDGTTNAWLYQSTSTFVRATQNYSLTGVSSFSVYAKAGTSSFLFIEQLGTTAQAWFNLSTGALGSTTGSVISSSITSVGGGWYRCVMSSTQSAGGELRIRMSDANLSSVTTAASNIYIQDAQLEAGDIATDYIATTSAAVSVGPVANVPRLDYLNSSCPRLLLEPQRTNLVTYSEYIADSSWVRINATITSNYGTSPEGVQNSSRIVCSNTTDSRLFISYGGTLTDGTVYTWSGWYKGTAGEKVVINAISSGGSAVNASKVITFTGDWQRENVTFTAGASLTYVFANDARVGSDTTATDFEYFGAQLEAGTYATSYIPTLGAAVTRGADASSKTGISSLIGQTEGTLFAEIKGLSNDTVRLAISDGTNNNNIYLELSSNNVVAVGRLGGVNQFAISSAQTITNNNKVAIKYKQNDFALYVNGVQVGTDTSGSTYSANTLNSLRFDRGDGGVPFYGNTKQVLIFPTALSNAQLAELTTL